MLFQDRASERDTQVVDTVRAFVPPRVFDVHAHLFAAAHLGGTGPAAYVQTATPVGRSRYRENLLSWLPTDQLRSIFFGFPARGADRAATNAWVAHEISSADLSDGGPGDVGLALAGPDDDPGEVAEFLDSTGFFGLKPYFYFVPGSPAGPVARRDEPGLEAIAPEWMWRLCHDRHGVMMLHIMRDGLADESNVASLVRLAAAYPRCTVVLAHAARGFTHRTVRAGIARIAPLDNIWLDTSAVCGTTTLATVLSEVGPRRIVYGSDFPISNLRGTNTAVGARGFEWLYASDPADDRYVLVGVESLLALRDACDALGLRRADVEDIFFRNAERLVSRRHPAVPPQT